MSRFTRLQRRGVVLPSLLLAVSAGCSDHPVAPTPLSEPGPAALSAATVSSGTSTFSVDDYSYWPCAGEVVHNVFDAKLRYSMVTNSQGSVYREVWLNQTGVGTVTGMTSGIVWRRDIKASPFVARDMGGGMQEYVYVGRFISETGPTLFVHEVYHVSSNANGELKIDRFESICDVKKNPN